MYNNFQSIISQTKDSFVLRIFTFVFVCVCGGGGGGGGGGGASGGDGLTLSHTL